MKTREKIILAVLCAIYLLVSLRYFPGRPVDTIIETLRHLLSSIPIAIGMTIISVSVLQKIVGEKLPYDRIARIYLTFGLIAEFFYALYDYTSRAV
ncbi:MAG: inner-membrane translocator [Desulfobulbaceae bacterium]|uniref:Inner-membrane translocator n=1 Tax=Candidatus Desulfobia pelagia TaxID=2841692 RepID=A0A8J6N9S6_9BACT|nr:inner-membrane translocator [Candidatus Desulfobia pelagia]